MRVAPSVVLFAVLLANGLAAAAEFQRHLYPSYGFSRLLKKSLVLQVLL